MSDPTRADREAYYLELTRATLPRLARERGWHVRLDHCFGRIVLDNVFERCWYEVLDRRRAAYRQLDDVELERAIAIAEGLPDDLRARDAASLHWRGKARSQRISHVRAVANGTERELSKVAPMDLTKNVPRSPNQELAGIVSLPRMIDKTRADAEGTLGEYDVDCPHDKPVLAFLGVDYATFKAKLEELHYDDSNVEAWAKPLVEKHGTAEVAAFNESRRDWKPDSHSQEYFDSMKAEVAPDRGDVTTWFTLLDLDEKRAA